MTLPNKYNARKKRDNPEQRLQMAVADYLALALKPPTIWTAFPAGGGGRVRGAFLKAMGLKAGWPDIVVMAPWDKFDAYHRSLVVGIELKAAKGRLSNAQEGVRSSFVQAGAHWFLARSVDEVEGFLRGVGIPLSATVAKEG